MALRFLLRALEARLRWKGVRRRRFESPDGRSISYLEAGRRDAKQTLVLVHGLGSSNLSWLRVIVPLARRHRVLAPDLPGFGRSPLPPGADYQSLADHVSALLAFLEGPQCLAPVVLAGQSMGGWVATKAALERPERVDQLVLVNAAGVYYETIRELRTLLTPRTRDEVHALWSRIWHRVPAYYRPFWKEAAANMQVANVHRFMDELRREDFIDGELPRLGVPLSIIWGRADKLLPADSVDQLLKAAPSARVHWLAKTGHVPAVESPRAFTSALLAIMDAQGPQRPLPPALAHAQPSMRPPSPRCEPS